jgi:hypothetical protein
LSTPVCIKKGSVDFQPPGIHGGKNAQRRFLSAGQSGASGKRLQGWHGHQGYAISHAQSFGRCRTNAQAGVRTRARSDCNRLPRKTGKSPQGLLN